MRKKTAKVKKPVASYKVLKFDTEAEWMEAREGIFTGTKAEAAGIKRGGGRKIGFYKILAERIAIPPDGENVMDRGKRLEEYALERFTVVTGKAVNHDKVLWVRKDDKDIAISPDGDVVGEPAAVEVKCLASANHIEAMLTNKVPSDYWEQCLQYFVVREDLEVLYFILYDPRMPVDLFVITLQRFDLEEEIKEQLEDIRSALVELRRLENELTIKL